MSTLRVNNITDTSGGSSSLSVPGAAKAWVNFNGTGTVAIRAQLNVSSITDNGVGTYQVNFTNALSDANYVLVGSADDNAGLISTYSGTYSTTTASVWSANSTTGGATDRTRIAVAIFR